MAQRARILQGTPTGSTQESAEPQSQSQIFNMDECRKVITHFVLSNENAFRCVGSEGFRQWGRQLQPQFTAPSRRTIAKDCYKLYLTEKLKLKTFFKTNCTSVALTTDCWTSPQKLSYLVITVFFTNNDGNDQKRIISFTLILGDKEDLDDSIERKVEEVLREWGIGNVSRVSSESTFSKGGSVLNTCWSSLSPRLVEALICTQSWLNPSVGVSTSGASRSGTAGEALPAAGPSV
ncbi:zinc finger BED domain-containing protein DAYSLEEPER-like [Trifolium pratense]|uniref:zinc finger BED domain-containing protein DAYSLEEPER-like n=1 Tax=Trifolium pratense TaxID=57577 RepID=UPI001E69183E|nr:zinc finger BED domain-containing protein DAYSLEEPER-like [Trifolium pratense]